MRRLTTAALLTTTLILSPSVAESAGRGGGKPASTSSCSLPESDAEGLEILNNYYPGYWWDHTHLTVAVQAHPSATSVQLAAIADAIETWDSVLRDCFDGLITLTDVTGSQRRAADIVVHYVPTAGGVVFGGYALCGAHKCPNIIVRSDLPPSLDREPYEPGVPRLGHPPRARPRTRAGTRHEPAREHRSDGLRLARPGRSGPVGLRSRRAAVRVRLGLHGHRALPAR